MLYADYLILVYQTLESLEFSSENAWKTTMEDKLPCVVCRRVQALIPSYVSFACAGCMENVVTLEENSKKTASLNVKYVKISKQA